MDVILHDRQKEMTDWLNRNKSKTEKDWLLEVRCKTEGARYRMEGILDALDTTKTPYEICYRNVNYQKENATEPINRIDYVDYDLCIFDENKKSLQCLIDVDMPESVLDEVIRLNDGSFCSINAYVWQLSQIVPEFDINSVSEETMRKILLSDMPKLSQKNGMGFRNWMHPILHAEILGIDRILVAGHSF